MHHAAPNRMGSGATHPPTVLLLLLLAQAGIALLPVSDAEMSWSLRVLGGALIVVGLTLNVAATRRFERHGTPVRPQADAAMLVTEGVFAHTRNPMYLGIALIIAGAALALGSFWALVAVPLFVAWIGRLIRWEEARLEVVFGDRYRAYRRRVRRWI